MSISGNALGSQPTQIDLPNYLLTIEPRRRKLLRGTRERHLRLMWVVVAVAVVEPIHSYACCVSLV